MNYFQDCVQDAFKAAFADYMVLSQDFFVEGGVIAATPVGADIQYDITAGWGCFKGEMMPVELVSVVKAPTQVVFLEVMDEPDDITALTNMDGTVEYVMRKRGLRLRVDNVYPASYVDIGAPRKSTLDILRFRGRLMMPGAMTPYYGPMNMFSIDGLGLSGTVMHGWALCNGLNGTPDMRGMTAIGATNVPDSGAPPYFNGVQQASNVGNRLGQDSLALNADHLPEHKHKQQSIRYTFPDAGGNLEASTGFYRIDEATDPLAKDTAANLTANNAIDMRQPSFAVVWIMSIVQ